MSSKKIIIYLMAAIFALSCTEETVQSVAGNSDYYPLIDSYQWKYQVKHECDCDCPCVTYPSYIYSYDYTFSYRVNGDTVVNNKLYKKLWISNTNEKYVAKMVRHEGSKYYVINSSGQDMLFLDTSAPIDVSWIAYESPDNDFKIIYTVRDVMRTMVIKGKIFKNVIKTEEIYSWADDDTTTCGRQVLYHYYAAGIGEVYVHRPYNSCTYYTGDENTYLLNTPGK